MTPSEARLVWENQEIRRYISDRAPSVSVRKETSIVPDAYYGRTFRMRCVIGAQYSVADNFERDASSPDRIMRLAVADVEQKMAELFFNRQRMMVKDLISATLAGATQRLTITMLDELLHSMDRIPTISE